MKKIILLTLFFMIVFSGFSATLNEFLKDSITNNTDYELILLNREKYVMDYDKNIIEANTERDLLNADYTYYSNMHQEKSSLISLYQGILADLFNVYSGDINLKIAEMNLADASETYQNNIDLNEKNIVSDNALKQSKLSLDENFISYNVSLRNYNEYIDTFSELTSMENNAIQIEILNPENYFVEDSEYVENDYSLKISDLTLHLSKYDLENMSSLSSQYDLKDKEIQVRQDELSYSNALETSNKANNDAIIDLNDKYTEINISKERLDISAEEFEDISIRYEKGLLSDSSFRASYVSMLNYEKNYYLALQNYYNALLNYLISIGEEIDSLIFSN